MLRRSVERLAALVTPPGTRVHMPMSASNSPGARGHSRSPGDPCLGAPQRRTSHRRRWGSAGEGTASPLRSAGEGGVRLWVCSSALASCLGVREVCSGSCRRLLELFAPLSRCSIFDLVGRVVASELALRLVGEQLEKADVGIGHDRVPGSGAGIARAAAWGSSIGRSSGPTRRKPRALWLVV
jgi:hypothetical protein